MPSLRDIKRRIGSVRNTQQITKAMKMVAAAKLRRAQDAMLRARPYADKIEEALDAIATYADEEAHPLLQRRVPRRVELVVMTSDRGLAGAFNSNVLRRAQRFLHENQDRYERIQVSTIGRKGRDFVRARNIQTRRDYPGVFEELTFDKAKSIAEELQASYLDDKLDAVFLLFNQFQSAISQKPTIVELLPIATEPADEGVAGGQVDFLYEPDRGAVLNELLPRHLAMQVWRALLESVASEHGARMAAMESATKNSGELIGKLKLQYNRARQAYITKELMEIVSGAEALK
ncbi:ATP synthase F1 subunit gamma [Vulgatibacter incomptus]|uniref:ATP synthase gamma chain n=1 Tax=Vulgatibacter incomptus TaxID=1391653 RepID=A0A0K1PH81_9BACT|nr:ATP synthase F1 subunit gamma [Vulgatibacter incomptus]AKU92867.1 ATP synthase gamma chain [Vulgatibacter incomptus]